MKAFIGCSFKERDERVITKIITFIESLDINCGDAKSAKSKPVEEKITKLIEDCEIFVGIFTCDEPVCKEEKKTKWYCKPRKENTIFTPSNWVIQESGFALGRNKKLILLKEKGVCNLPKLQGNLEYIPFDRNHIEESFLKISQMISDIKTKDSGEVAEKSSEGLSSPKETKPEEQKKQPKEDVENKKDKLFHKVYSALWGDKDYNKAQTIFDEEAEAVLDVDDRLWLRAFILRESPSLGNQNAFEQLEKLAQENPNNPRVIKQLAIFYKEIREFRRAREKFLLAADQYDVSDTDKKEGLVDAYIQAAWCLAYDDDPKAALEMLRKLLSNSNFLESRAEIFEAMARISKNKSNIDDFMVYAEAALDANPVNTPLRFELAYAYGDNSNENLSLFHYKKLTDAIKHSTGLNNMGVSYGRLGIKAKSMKCYFKAAKENETLSMGNLAHEYVSAGFIDDAQRLIDEAYKLHNDGVEVNPRVGDAQQKIKDLLEDETKKEEKILSEAKKESQYRVKYSNALCSDITMAKSQIEGDWQTSRGVLRLNYQEESNSFQINSQVRIKEDPLLSAMLAGQTRKQEEHYKNRLINISGSISNLSGKYTIKVSDETGATLLTTGWNDYEATGYMVISENCDCIEIMEKTKDGKIKFEQWKKQPFSSKEKNKGVRHLFL